VGVLQVSIFILLPFLLMEGEKRLKWMSFFGTVVWCYLIGILIGNLTPDLLNKELTNSLVEVLILLAVPLLLFSLDLKKWMRNTKSTITSFIISLVSISIASVSVSFLFKNDLKEVWKVGGMLVGVYSGGTVNMSAIGKSLAIENETFLLVNAADIFVSSFYMLFVLMAAKKLLSPYFPKFQSSSENQETKEVELGFNFKEGWKALLLSLIVAGSSVGLSFLFFNKLFAPIILMGCTSLGILFSFSSKIRNLKSSFILGEYLLYIFCIGLGSMCDFREVAVNAPSIVQYVTLVLLIAISLHFIGAKFFKIDFDTAIITNVAAVFGPAFIAPVARTLGNREIIVTGLTCGLMGYAVGNYLGLGIAELIKYFLN